jgi:hypothetical protein
VRIGCENCQTQHELEPPPWVVASGRPFRFRCSACGYSQSVQPPAAADDAPLPGKVTPAPAVVRSTPAPAPAASPPPPVTPAPAMSAPVSAVPAAVPAAVAPASPAPAAVAADAPLFLRQGGQVFRVRDRDTLRRWIAEGRVLPADEVSADQAHWTAVAAEPEFASLVPEAAALSVAPSPEPVAAPLPSRPPVLGGDSPFAAAADPARTLQWNDDDTEGVPTGLPPMSLDEAPRSFALGVPPAAVPAAVPSAPPPDEPAPPALLDDAEEAFADVTAEVRAPVPAPVALKPLLGGATPPPALSFSPPVEAPLAAAPSSAPASPAPAPAPPPVSAIPAALAEPPTSVAPRAEAAPLAQQATPPRPPPRMAELTPVMAPPVSRYVSAAPSAGDELDDWLEGSPKPAAQWPLRFGALALGFALVAGVGTAVVWATRPAPEAPPPRLEDSLSQKAISPAPSPDPVPADPPAAGDAAPADAAPVDAAPANGAEATPAPAPVAPQPPPALVDAPAAPKPAPAPAPAAPKPASAPAAPKPANVSALVDKGWNSVESNPAAAKSAFRQALDASPGNAGASYGLGYTLLKTGDAAGAQPYLCAASKSRDVEMQREIQSLLQQNGLSCN